MVLVVPVVLGVQVGVADPVMADPVMADPVMADRVMIVLVRRGVRAVRVVQAVRRRAEDLGGSIVPIVSGGTGVTVTTPLRVPYFRPLILTSRRPCSTAKRVGN